MAQQCSMTFMKQAYYASCIVVCMLLLCKLAELGLTNAYYGFSAAWIAPRLAFWGYEQLEHMTQATGSLHECVSIPGDSALCKSFANLFDKVRLGSSLNNVKITAIAADGQISYDYWSSQYSIFIIVTASAFEDAVWSTTVSCGQWCKDAISDATKFHIIELTHRKSSWSKNELDSAQIELKGKSRTELEHFIAFAHGVYGDDAGSARLRQALPRSLTEPLMPIRSTRDIDVNDPSDCGIIVRPTDRSIPGQGGPIDIEWLYRSRRNDTVRQPLEPTAPGTSVLENFMTTNRVQP
jgi:hypothetical protein